MLINYCFVLLVKNIRREYKIKRAIALALVLTLVFPFTVLAGGLPDNTIDATPAESYSFLPSADSVNALGATPTVGKTYNLRTLVSTSSFLNVWGGIDADGTRVDMWAKDGSAEQKFKLINGSTSGTYRLQAVCSSSNRVVDAYSPSRPIQSGASVDIWLPNDAAAQNLSIIKVGANTYKIVLSSYSTLALTAVSTSNDGAVKFNTYTGANNQLWVFSEVGGSSSGSAYGNMGWLWPIYDGTANGVTCPYQGYSGHHGIDIGGVPKGTKVRSAQAGQVFASYYVLKDANGNITSEDDSSANYGCGYAIAIRTNDLDPTTGNKLIYMYQHLCEAPKLSSGTVLNTVGTSVSKGIQIGKVGETGNAQGVHLHMQITNNGSWHHNNDYSQSVDPALFYPNVSMSNISRSQPTTISSLPGVSTKLINDYYVDLNVVLAIGEEKFDAWVKQTYANGGNPTLSKLLSDFNISIAEFEQLTANSNLNYDYAYIETSRNNITK